MPPTIARTFNALNGYELKKIIVQELDNILARSDDFKQHICYKEFRYEFTLNIEAYRTTEKEPITVETGRHMIQYDEDTGKAIAREPGEYPVVLELKSNRAHDSRKEPPDLIRKEQGMPIPTPRVVDGQIVEQTMEDVTNIQREAGVQPPASPIVRDATEPRIVEVRRDLPAPPRVGGGGGVE